MKNVFKVSSVIIGTLIGAGFASGKEIYVFFGRFGIFGNIGIILSSCLLGFIIYITFSWVYNFDICSYEVFLKKLIGNKYRNNMKFIVNVFLLITFFIMTAGFGSYFSQELELNYLFGVFVIAVLSFLVFTHSINGIIKVNEVLIPLLIFILLMTFLINFNCYSKDILSNLNCSSFDIAKSVVFSVLYVGYNSILLVPLIVELTKFLKTKQSFRYVSFLVFVVILSLSFVVLFLISKVNYDISSIDLPILCIDNLQSNLVLKNIYGTSILFAIFTSCISVGYSFLKNVSTSKSYKKIAFLMCSSSLVVSKIGFSNLVSLLYPIFGFLGIFQIFAIIRGNLLKKSKKTDIK